MISKRVDKRETVCALSLFLGILGGVLGGACSTAKITLLSSPSRADVYLSALGDGKPKWVGQTPIKMTAAELSKAYGGAGPVFLEFKRNGYSSAKAIVTDLGAVDLTINMDLPPTSGLEDQVRLNFIVDSIFESQRLAKAGREEDALSRLREIEKDAPQLAAIYELEGGIYYLQKKYKEALDAYTLASNHNPKNPQVVRMRNYLEASLGVKKVDINEPTAFDQTKENFPLASPTTSPTVSATTASPTGLPAATPTGLPETSAPKGAITPPVIGGQ